MNKSKNGEENSPPNGERNSSTYNKTSQILNVTPPYKNRKNYLTNNMIQNKIYTITDNNDNNDINDDNEKNDKDENNIDPKTKIVLAVDLFSNENIEIYNMV